MKIERTRNATRNVIFGVIQKLYNLILPFVIRTAMIYWLGIEYLGLNSLFTSILQVLNLAELGVGSAMVFSMYKPIVDDDQKKICAMIRLYRIYYRIIGGVVLGLGLILLPFIPKLISGNIPTNINVYVLYVLNLGATVLTYWLFAYRNSIFQAYQRTDVISKVSLVTDTVKYGGQILVLAIFRNYYLYVLVLLFSQVLNNVVIAIFSKKMYPQYVPVGNLPSEEKKEIRKRITDLFTSKVGGTIVNSADTIIISAFLGLRVLAIYQNYYYIISAIMGIITIIFTSVTAGSGNSILTETREKNYQDFKKITWITYWMVSYAICGMFCLYQPLMRIWVGNNLLLSDSFVPLLCLYFWGLITILLVGVYKDAAGIWHQDRFRPLISGAVNLLLNLALVKQIGLYGILLSTIISVFCISIPWILYNVFTKIFPEKIITYLKDVVLYFGITIVVTAITSWVCNLIDIQGVTGFIIKLVVCTVVCNVLLLISYCRTSVFMVTVKQIKRSIFLKS